MGIPRDVTPYGSQTVVGPGWPNVEEEQLESAAAEYEAFAAKLTGSVVPEQSSQLTNLMADWGGLGAVSATGEATSIIGGHEANAAQAAKIALQLHEMAAAVARTKTMANATAAEVQAECEALQAMSALVSNTQQLIDSRIKMGLSQNVAIVNGNTTELAAGLGVPPNVSNPGAPPGTASTEQAGEQMMGQMLGMAAQLPGQLMGMITQVPQQLTQPLQQLAQPLQSLSSMFSGKSGTGVSSSASPFSSFSNHPLAGGSGAGGGAGLTKAASMPGAGGSPAQTPTMAKLVGGPTGGVGAPVAGAGAGVGLAPVAAGMGSGSGMGMMPHRGEGGGGGNVASLAAPLPLDHDVDEESDDEW